MAPQLSCIRRSVVVVSLLVLLLGCQQSTTVTIQTVPDPKKSGGGYVSNPDQIINGETVAQINGRLTTLDQDGKAQVAVVLLNSIGNQVPKEFAVALFNYWKIGRKGKDDGLLILVVKDQHRVEFETGYGLEGILTDVICYRIQQDYMIAHFKAGDFNAAMIDGVDQVIAVLNGTQYPQPDAAIDETAVSQSDTAQKQESGLQATPDIEGEPGPIPVDTTWNWLFVLIDSLIFLIFYSVFTIGIVSLDRSKKDKRKSKDRKDKREFTLFRNNLYNGYLFTLLFLLSGPIVILEFLSYFYNTAEFSFFVPLGAVYVTWCIFVHLYFMVLLPASAARATSGLDRHQRHEKLAEGYKTIKAFSYVFPLPFLIFYRRWHQARMIKLREEPYVCQCGKQMIKLDEFDDNKYLSEGEVLEEQLKAIDYDVWICNSCNRTLVFEYEDFNSRILRCQSCTRKTLELVNREVVREATKSSSGYGYEHYTCRNCKSEEKIKYTIPRLSDSSGSSSFGSSSSGSSDWGGGSSGGGGAGSSW